MSSVSLGAERQVLALSEITQRLAPVGTVERVFSEDVYPGVTRTAFCHTAIPNSVVLASSTDWLAKAIESPNVACVITTPGVFSASRIGEAPARTVITVTNAAESFYHLHNQALHHQIKGPPFDNYPIVANDARIASSAVLDGPVIVESGAQIGHHVVIQGPVRIGRGTRIDAQCAVGVDGLFTKRVNGCQTHIRHYGGVDIGANCHLHAGCNVACAVNFRERTSIGDGVSLGPRAVIGHDSRVDNEATISTQAAIMGRAHVGSRCWVGAAALISNGIRVGEDATVRIGAVVLRNVAAGGDVSGNFAVPHSSRLKEFVRTEMRQV